MEKLPAEFRWIERISRLMDDKFHIPGTNFRFGLDPILNLIPIAGDIPGFAVSALLVLAMAKRGVSRKVLVLMMLNVILDSAIGAIPLIGQIFDFVYKSNTRNIRLLKEHYEEGRHQGSGTGVLAGIFLFLLLFLALTAYAAWKLSGWVISLF